MKPTSIPARRTAYNYTHYNYTRDFPYISEARSACRLAAATTGSKEAIILEATRRSVLDANTIGKGRARSLERGLDPRLRGHGRAGDERGNASA